MLDGRDGLELAGLVRRRAVSALELADAAIARVERLNGALNAVVTPMFEQARDQARRLDSAAAAGATPSAAPFAGVPFLVKDLMVFIPGVPLSNGSRAFRGFVPAGECAQARMIREAGFVVLGKTNTPELGNSAATNPVAFGPTRNPWDLALNSGGSSGGSAAAVAARLVPLAASSDGGGSIRLPASHCGVFGLKPSRGRNPHDPPEIWSGAVVSHAITVSVRDSAAYLDWSGAGIAADDPARPRPGSLLAEMATPPRGLRVGLCLDSPAGGPVHPDCRAAADAAARLLEELGHRVEPCPLPYDGRRLLRAFLTVVSSSTAEVLKVVDSLLGRRPSRRELEPLTRYMGEVGKGVSAERLAGARAEWQAAARAMERFHQRFDVLLSPVAAIPPHPHDALDPSPAEKAVMDALARLRLGRFLGGDAALDHAVDRGMAATAFTPLANATGQPAMAVPLHWTAAGLPVGAQFTAAHNRDGLLLALAAQLEQAAPWAGRRPPGC